MFSFTGLYSVKRCTALIKAKQPLALVYIYRYLSLSLQLRGVFYHYYFVYNTPYRFLLRFVMAGVTLNYMVTFSVFSLGIIWLYLKRLVHFTKYKPAFWKLKSFNSSFTLITPIDMYKFVFYQVLAITQFKVMAAQWFLPDKIWFVNIELFLILIVILVYAGTKLTKDLEELHLIFIVIVFFFIAMVSFIFAKNLFLWFLALELVGVVYYFFFLHALSKNTLSVIRYKNLLSNYLWMSFFLLMLLAVVLFVIINTAGTLSFHELVCLSPELPILWPLVVLILLWKTGAPGFHFLKFELYQYMPVYTLLAFSALSLFINFFVLQFLATIIWQVLVAFRFSFLIYVLVVNIVLMTRGLRSTSFYQFLGLSALNTTTLLFMFLLV